VWLGQYFPKFQKTKVPLPSGLNSIELPNPKKQYELLKHWEMLTRFLLEGSFYTIQEYFDWNLLSNPSTRNLPTINDC
jgi:hypothetical protein